MSHPFRFQAAENALEKIVSENKNAADLLCPVEGCNCVIMKKDAATLVERPDNKLALPASVLPASQELQDLQIDDGMETHFWRLTNMMDFENIGFSKTVDSVKYLSCAECDVGPVGYHDTQSDPKEYLISVKRARYRF
ncbi:Mss4-like protein [Syncephalastrum racemosum]|uniref:Mss4-like protein n=1 Tax=Syncephalastrum racemosum TaxID=13706 RepID=A0A1X2HJ57_SYNRA|nr:Mss4-like protein [Syncephalastrum racemosum]